MRKPPDVFRIRTYTPFLLASLLASALAVAPGRAQVGAAPASTPGVEPESAADEAERHVAEIVERVAAGAPDLLARYIRIDTTNPPGNERAGVELIAAVLREAGIEPGIFEPAAGRGNLYARLKGSGRKRPIILLHHVDVVPADPAEWSRLPFGGARAGGEVHGRGALDAKGVGTTQVLAVVALAKLAEELDLRLARDVIVLATSDEETGGRLGARWMVEEKLELFSDAEFVLNEGGFIHAAQTSPAPGGRPPLIYNLNAAEKGPCWFRVVATGEPGHASRPAPRTAVTRLVDALDELVGWERPYEVGPVVAGYYAAYAALDHAHARQFRQLDRSLEDPEFREWFLSDPAAAALVYDTLTPTVLRASKSTNIVPAEASAVVDARLLPGHDCGEFLRDVRKRVGSPHVRIEPSEVAFPSSQSPLSNEFTEAVERVAAAELGGAVVLPGLQAGFTDSHYFRAKGIAAYGFTPIVITPEQRLAVHGPDERVTATELSAGVIRLVRLLREISD